MTYGFVYVNTIADNDLELLDLCGKAYHFHICKIYMNKTFTTGNYDVESYSTSDLLHNHKSNRYWRCLLWC